MDYLIRRRKSVGHAHPAETDVDTMWLTFGKLDCGRRALAGLTGRQFTRFKETPVVEQLKNQNVVKRLLALDCKDGPPGVSETPRTLP